MIQQFYSKGYSKRNVSQVTIKAPAHTCLLQHYSQQLSYGNSQDAALLMNGLRKCGIFLIKFN
jgi:hypothetical protein